MNIDPKRLYAWQKAAQQLLPVDPAGAVEMRALRPANKRGTQELNLLKKPLPLAKCLRRIFASLDLMSPLHFIDQQRVHYSVWQLCQMLGVVFSCDYAWQLARGSGAVGP